MSISSVTSKIIYTGDGTTKVFPYPFRILAQGDLTVTRYYEATGSTSVLVLNTDYAVSGAGESAGGNVTLTGSYTSLPSGSKLVIQREMDLTQGVDYVENDVFSAETHERALDRLTMITQQLKEFIDRSLARDITREGAYTLPEAEGDKLIGWRVDALNLENKTVQSLGTMITDTDGTLVANSDSRVATQKATKTYADTKAPIANPTFTGTVNAVTLATTLLTSASLRVSGTSNFITVISTLLSCNSLDVALTANIISIRATSITASILRISGTSNFVTLISTLLSSNSLDISLTANITTVKSTLLTASTLNISGTGNFITVSIGEVAPTSPLQVVGLSSYSTNALASAGGLTVGAFYRTTGNPSQVCVVY